MANLISTQAVIEKVDYDYFYLKTVDGASLRFSSFSINIRHNGNEDYVPFVFGDKMPLHIAVDISYSIHDEVCSITSDEIELSAIKWFERFFFVYVVDATYLKIGGSYYVNIKLGALWLATKDYVSVNLGDSKLYFETNNGAKVPYTAGVTPLSCELYTLVDIVSNGHFYHVTVKPTHDRQADPLPSKSDNYDHITEFCKLIGSESNTTRGAAAIIMQNVLHKLEWRHKPSVEFYETAIAKWLYRNVNKTVVSSENPISSRTHHERVKTVTCLLFDYDVCRYISALPFGTDSFIFEGVKYDGNGSFHIIMPGGVRLEDTLKMYK